MVRGFSINPDRPNGWASASLGLTPARNSALAAIGMNAVREWGASADRLLTGTPLTNAIAAQVAWVGHAVAEGYTLVNFTHGLGPLPASHWQAIVGAQKATYLTNVATLAAALWAAHGSAVAFTPMNEPNGVTQTAYIQWTRDVFAAIRAVAPNLRLMFESRDLSHPSLLAEFTPSHYDANTFFAFHGYTVGELTHYWNYAGMPQITYPAEMLPGGKEPLKAAAPTYAAVIDYIFATCGSRRAMKTAWIDPVIAWADGHGLPRSRIFCNEFGFFGDWSWSGTQPAYDDNASRARYYHDIAALCADAGFGGTFAWQALGDFEMFVQTAVTDPAASVLIPEIATGLHLATRTGPVSGSFSPPAFTRGGVAFSDSYMAVDCVRASEVFALDGGAWKRFGPNIPVVTSAGLLTSAARTVVNFVNSVRRPTTTAAAAPTMSGFDLFGAANVTIARVNDAAALAASGLSEMVPAGIVYEVVNSGASEIQRQMNETMPSVAHVASLFARVTAGSGARLGKMWTTAPREDAIPAQATYARVERHNASGSSLGLKVPAGCTVRFVAPMAEHGTAAGLPTFGATVPADAVTWRSGGTPFAAGLY